MGYLKRPEIAELASATFRLSGSGARLEANHFCPVWSAEAMHQLLSMGGRASRPGPTFEALYQRWIGEDIPAGSDRFGLVSAWR